MYPTQWEEVMEYVACSRTLRRAELKVNFFKTFVLCKFFPLSPSSHTIKSWLCTSLLTAILVTMKRRVTVAEAGEKLPFDGGERFVRMFEHGSLQLELYAPRGHDLQTPHTRDEVYVVVSGSGMFRHGEQLERFGPGDSLFVEAGLEHRFESFSDDFAVWVLFYGPEGGEG